MSAFESTLIDMWEKGMQAYATRAQKDLVKEADNSLIQLGSVSSR